MKPQSMGFCSIGIVTKLRSAATKLLPGPLIPCLYTHPIPDHALRARLHGLDDLVQPTCQAKLDPRTSHHRDDLDHHLTDHRRHFRLYTRAGDPPNNPLESHDCLWDQPDCQSALHTHPVRHAQPAPRHPRHSHRLRFDPVAHVGGLAPLPLGDFRANPLPDLGLHRDHAASEHHGHELGAIAAGRSAGRRLPGEPGYRSGSAFQLF